MFYEIGRTQLFVGEFKNEKLKKNTEDEIKGLKKN